MKISNRLQRKLVKELTPYIREAVRVHPNSVYLRLLTGNASTALGYARLTLNYIKKHGVPGQRELAQIVDDLYPRLHIRLCSEGLEITGEPIRFCMNDPNPICFEKAKKLLPMFKVDSPSLQQVDLLIDLLETGKLRSCVAITNLPTAAGILAGTNQQDSEYCIHVFRDKPHIVLWPERNKSK